MNEDEAKVLLATSDQDLVRALEQETEPEKIEEENERKLILRFFNLARKGAGMPLVAVQ